MVCPKCAKGRHKKCEYPKSCSCQHKKPEKADEPTGDPTDC